MNEEQTERLLNALEGIDKSLNYLAETAKANKRKVEHLGELLQDLKDDPFGIK